MCIIHVLQLVAMSVKLTGLRSPDVTINQLATKRSAKVQLGYMVFTAHLGEDGGIQSFT